MNNLTLKNLPEAPLPENFHVKIMRKILLVKFRTFFVLTFAFLSLNFIVVIHRIAASLAETEALKILGDVIKDFELSRDFISTFFGMGVELLPVNLIIIGIINIALLAYLAGASYKFKKFLKSSAV